MLVGGIQLVDDLEQLLDRHRLVAGRPNRRVVSHRAPSLEWSPAADRTCRPSWQATDTGVCKPCTVVDRAPTSVRLGPLLPTALVVLAVLIATKGPLYRVRIALGDLGPGRDFIDDRWVQGSFLVVYAALVIVFWRARSRLWRAAAPVVASQAAFVGVVIVSAAWSIATRRTLEQGVMLAAGTAGFALAATSLSPRRMVMAIWAAMQIGVVASLVAGWGDWEYAFDRNGDLAGIYLNRNSLGAVAALGVLTSIALAVIVGARRRTDITERPPIVALAVIVGGGALDAVTWLASGSLTPAFAVIVALVAAALVGLAVAPGPRQRVRRAVAGALGIAVVAGAVVIVAARAWLTESLGRSTTLSGRTVIWGEMIEAWQRRPVAGFGFMAVWFDPEVRAGLIERGRDVYEAHSGYIEVLVGTGVVGAAILAVTIVIGVVSVARAAGRDPDPVRLWLVMAVAFSLAANLGETYIGANLLVWYVFVIATVQSRILASDER